MIWNVIYFVLGCILLAEIIYCLMRLNSSSAGGVSLTRPFGLDIGRWPGGFLRVLLCVAMVALFYVACCDFFG